MSLGSLTPYFPSLATPMLAYFSLFSATAATQQPHRPTIWFLGDVALLAARKSIRTMFHLRVVPALSANTDARRRISRRYTRRITRVRRSESLFASRRRYQGPCSRPRFQTYSVLFEKRPIAEWEMAKVSAANRDLCYLHSSLPLALRSPLFRYLFRRS